MNYLKEINSFYDWLETNSLSDSAIVLWHALMHINNRAGWITEFAVAISTLSTKTGLKKDAIVRARNRLQQVGRIDFRSRSGQQSAVYKMIPFESFKQTQTATQTDCVVLTDTNSDTNRNTNRAQTAPQTASIIKLNETKLDDTKNPSADDNPFIFYEQNFGVIGSMVQQDIIAWETVLPTELIIEAMKRSVKANKRSWKYVESILQSWHRNGIKTIEAAMAEQAEHERQKAAKGGRAYAKPGQSYDELYAGKDFGF